MNTISKFLALALIFLMFWSYCAHLCPDRMGTVDKAILFVFGTLAGLGLGLFWADVQFLKEEGSRDLID